MLRYCSGAILKDGQPVFLPCIVTLLFREKEAKTRCNISRRGTDVVDTLKFGKEDTQRTNLGKIQKELLSN